MRWVSAHLHRTAAAWKQSSDRSSFKKRKCPSYGLAWMRVQEMQPLLMVAYQCSVMGDRMVVRPLKSLKVSQEAISFWTTTIKLATQS